LPQLLLQERLPLELGVTDQVDQVEPVVLVLEADFPNSLQPVVALVFERC
jgi:hypothetical protein